MGSVHYLLICSLGLLLSSGPGCKGKGNEAAEPPPEVSDPGSAQALAQKEVALAQKEVVPAPTEAALARIRSGPSEPAAETISEHGETPDRTPKDQPRGASDDREAAGSGKLVKARQEVSEKFASETLGSIIDTVCACKDASCREPYVRPTLAALFPEKRTMIALTPKLRTLFRRLKECAPEVAD